MIYEILRYDDDKFVFKTSHACIEAQKYFRFTFEKDGVKYGTVYVTVDNSRNLVLYYGDEVVDSF